MNVGFGTMEAAYSYAAFVTISSVKMISSNIRLLVRYNISIKLFYDLGPEIPSIMLLNLTC